ncbi:MAG: RloB family protein [Bacteroidota bacterium]
MARGRRRFERPLGNRRYRKLFIIAAEGTKTEPKYFGIFNNQQAVVKVTCIKSRNGESPPQVLQRMKTYIQQESLKESDEAWLVVDKDSWTDDQLRQLHEWSEQRANYGFALSNPDFEYWLLLHFEDGDGITNARECMNRILRHWPDYQKDLDPRKITSDMIKSAIYRGKRRDTPPCPDWPRNPGGTTVYRLVENIMST